MRKEKAIFYLTEDTLATHIHNGVSKDAQVKQLGIPKARAHSLRGSVDCRRHALTVSVQGQTINMVVFLSRVTSATPAQLRTLCLSSRRGYTAKCMAILCCNTAVTAELEKHGSRASPTLRGVE